jgi:hypothetical protein
VENHDGRVKPQRAAARACKEDAMTDQPQPWIDEWPLSKFDEARSKLPVLADIEAARIKLARRFNSRPLPKAIETDLAWKEHHRARR